MSHLFGPQKLLDIYYVQGIALVAGYLGDPLAGCFLEIGCKSLGQEAPWPALQVKEASGLDWRAVEWGEEDGYLLDVR